ncbi:MAG: hypothetical protein H6528_09415 [Actinobacteria bacterium]|nr:hypothetical protein [Actinomycetota bacterium]HRY09266.1 hypothetical protein [Candidatus Nanopelagicales bacterium]
MTNSARTPRVSDMDVDWLISDEGRAVIAALRGVDPLRAREVVPDLSAQRVAEALTQAQHRPADFPLTLVTIDGIQQATPPAVAARRAQRLAESGVRTIVDAGCGIGVDSWAFAKAGLHVIAYEVDPVTAAVARANLPEVVDVRHGDATTAELPADAALYVDPARRLQHRDAQGRPIRVHDPQRWSPPWSWVLGQAHDRPVVARIRPGHRDLPENIEWHCSSIGRSLVDATAWFPPLAAVPRRASVFQNDGWHEVAGSPESAGIGEAGAYIVDPDPAIVRSGLVGNVAHLVGGRLLDPRLAFITCDDHPPQWVGRSMRVVEQTSIKGIAASCRRLGIDSATLWARGFDTLPRTGVRHGQRAIVVAARIGDPRRSVAWVGHSA